MLDCAKNCKILFGSYCQVFQDNQPSDTDKECTVPAICLGPTGNLQGSYVYFSLESGKKITRPQATSLLITDSDSIIEWVEKISRLQNMSENIVFMTNRGEIVKVDDDYEAERLEIDESQYFPTELPQECDPTSEPSDEELGIVPPLEEPAYDFIRPHDGRAHVIHDYDEGDADVGQEPFPDYDDNDSSRLIGYNEYMAAEQEQAAASALNPIDVVLSPDGIDGGKRGIPPLEYSGRTLCGLSQCPFS